MKILTPVNSPREVAPLVDAGANEIYCGLMLSNWKSRGHSYLSFSSGEDNRANVKSLQELKHLINTCHEHEVPLFLALNATTHSPWQLETIRTILLEADGWGMNAFIFADPALFVLAGSLDLKAEFHVSLFGAVLNHRTAQFYKNLGASRFVFPTQLSVNEVRTMTQRLGDLFEYEIIGLNDACRFLEGFCQFHHSFDDKLPFKQFVKNANIRFFILDRLKRLPFSWQRYIERNKLFQHYISSPCDFCCQISGYDTSKDGNRPEPNPEALFNDFLDTFSYCNLCGLYDFIDMGLQTVKVVGRFNPLAKKVKDVKILRRACELAVKPGISRESYVKLCQNDFKKTFGFPCRRFCLYSVSSTLKQNRVRRVG